MIESIIRAFDTNLKISTNYTIRSNIAVGIASQTDTKIWCVVCSNNTTGTYGILHSYDGINWFANTQKNAFFKSYSFGQPIFLIYNPNAKDFTLFNIGNSAKNVFKSINGIDWFLYGTVSNSSDYFVNSTTIIKYINNRFIMIGHMYATDESYIYYYTSTDGRTWIKQMFPYFSQFGLKSLPINCYKILHRGIESWIFLQGFIYYSNDDGLNYKIYYNSLLYNSNYNVLLLDNNIIVNNIYVDANNTNEIIIIPLNDLSTYTRANINISSDIVSKTGGINNYATLSSHNNKVYMFNNNYSTGDGFFYSCDKNNLSQWSLDETKSYTNHLSQYDNYYDSEFFGSELYLISTNKLYMLQNNTFNQLNIYEL